MLAACVCAPYVAGVGGAGLLGGYLMPLGRVGADELPFLGEEMGRVWVGADAIEALARRRHSGGGDGHPLCVPCGNVGEVGGSWGTCGGVVGVQG